MIIPNDQHHALDESDLEAEALGELELDPRAADGVRGGALQPYLSLKGQKSGHIDGSLPPAH